MNIKTGSTNQVKNVQFLGMSNDWTYEVPTSRDATFSAADTTDTIQDFMSRPVMIYTGQWSIGDLFLETFNPWDLFFSDSRVAARIKNFRNLRCDLKIKVVINGNPFYYGRMLVSYLPLPLNDDRTPPADGTFTSILTHSQLPHIYLDPTTSTGGDMVLPYFFPKDALNVPAREWRTMGSLRLQSVVELKHANSIAGQVMAPINITIFAMPCNVQLSTPTSVAENQSDEYTKPSAIAHNIAHASGWLTRIPTIAPYARATQMIASGLGNLASLFGYSRPRVTEESSSMRQRIGTFAVTNTPDNIASLAVDGKKEITIDPRVVGLTPNDEMVLTAIAQRESFLDTFTWRESDGNGEFLWNMRVAPTQCLKSGSANYLTPAAYCALPFRYWRGTMKIRLSIVASAYHRGRLRIVWDPEYLSGVSEVYNTNYSTIIDISDTKDFEFKVGWGQNYSYLESPGLISAFGTIPYTTGSIRCNGVVGVYVVNKLTSPADEDHDVTIMVSVSMDDDFEVAGPDISFLEAASSLRYSPIPNPEEYEPTLPPDPGIDVPEPESPTNPTPVTGSGSGLAPRIIPYSFVNPTTVHDDGVLTSDASALAVLVPNTGSFRGTIKAYVAGTTTLAPLVSASVVEATTTQTTLSTGSVINTPAGGSFVLETDSTASFVQMKFAWDATKVQIESIYVDTVSIVPYPVTVTTTGDYSATMVDGVWEITSGATGNFSISTPYAYEVAYLNITGAPGTVVTSSVSGSSFPIPYNSGPGEKIVGVIFAGTYTFPSTAGTLSLRGALFATSAVQNQADETLVDPMNPSAAPVATDPIALSMGPCDLPGATANSVYFGEQIVSWRQMLKRYEPLVRLGTQNETSNFKLGLYSGARTQAGPLPVQSLTMRDYITSAFAAERGGLRVRVVPLDEGARSSTVGISRLSSLALSPGYFVDGLPTYNGGALDVLAVTGTADAEIPYYSNLRFWPARAIAQHEPQLGRDYHQIQVHVRPSSDASYAVFTSVAEDYSLHFFLAAPILVY